MSNSDSFSPERLEFLAYTRRHEEAAVEIIRMLEHLDARHGGLVGIGVAPTSDLAAELRDTRFATRIASAVAALFSDPNFQLSAIGFQRFIPLQRWLAIVFGASPLANADHIIHLFNQQGYDRPDQITLKDQDLLKFSLLYSLDSAIPLQPEILWGKDRKLAAALFCALLSSRIVASEKAQEKKEQLLAWLPPRLGEVELDDIPIGILHDVWMHCSYAQGRDKHAIKRAINQLVRNRLIASGFSDLPTELPSEREKPVLMCVLEWFVSGHAMYRGHSLSIEALKRRYHLIGVSMRESSDEVSRRIFDEVHVLRRSNAVLDTVREVRDLAAAAKPDVIYYPSVGMFPDTVFLVNLRLAPIQVVALGHPATTHSPFIDYVVADEDIVGDPECFSEKVVAIPPIPHRPPADSPDIPHKVRRTPGHVKVAVAASVMKINPLFLATLRLIAEQSSVPLEIQLYSGSAFGLGKIYLQNLVRNILGDRAVMFPHLPYAEYIENINTCDMFLNPFPFGNTTGIVDTVRQGLPGICLTGPEVHSHIDEALFRRLGMPSWTITKTPDEYVAAAIRMAEKGTEREKIAKDLLKMDPDAVLFKRDAGGLCDAIEWVHRNHEQLRTSPARLLHPPKPTTKRAAH